MKLPILVRTSGWKKTVFSLLFLGLNTWALGQTKTEQTSHEISVMFYNVENLFDTENDPLTLDDEFTPEGDRRWNAFRLKAKLNHISKVIMAANGFNPPAIVGLCEVENRWVLEQLLEQTPLKQFGYRIIHKDSPDERGIDVALLFRAEMVNPIAYQYIPLIKSNGDPLASREILQATFGIGTEQLVVFFNHWPSRYGGQAETEAKRKLAASTLKQEVERLYDIQGEVKLAILGDFNDEPQNGSIAEVLGVVAESRIVSAGDLVALTNGWKPGGSLKHQQSWQIFDQVFVSDYLLGSEGMRCTTEDARLVDLPFLFEKDDKWGATRPFRTYRGYQYTGGFSDHLPVLLTLHF